MGFYFPKIDKMLKKAKSLDDTDAWFYVMDQDAKDEVIRLNTQDQLYDEGIDSLENSLGEYSLVTQMIKTGKGQRIDHVTLRDRGDFYNSFFVLIKVDSLEIYADDEGDYDRPLTDVYGDEIIGLTKESQSWLGAFILPKYKEYVEKQLLQ